MPCDICAMFGFRGNERGQTAKSTLDGIMGRQEKRVLDMIAQKTWPT